MSSERTSRIDELLARSSLGSEGASALIQRVDSLPGTASTPARFRMLLSQVGSWRDQAACRDHRDGVAQEQPIPVKVDQSASDAKKPCLECPVRVECLEDALLHDERFNLWSELAQRERNQNSQGDIETA